LRHRKTYAMKPASGAHALQGIRRALKRVAVGRIFTRGSSDHACLLTAETDVLFLAEMKEAIEQAGHEVDVTNALGSVGLSVLQPGTTSKCSEHHTSKPPIISATWTTSARPSNASSRTILRKLGRADAGASASCSILSARACPRVSRCPTTRAVRWPAPA
jgi:hypothetical protein